MNPQTFGIEQVKTEMAQGLAACDTFHGFRYFAGSKYLQEFLSLIGKLRYQQRWAKAVRMPETFVMGHMLVVAILSYFMSLELDNPCRKRLENNFFSGLFTIYRGFDKGYCVPCKEQRQGFGQHNQ